MIEFLVAVVSALLLTPLVIWLAHRWSLIDEPNHRSSHSSPVPRGGGLAVAVAAIVGVAAATTWTDRLVGVVVGASVLGITGLLDDRWGLPAAPRLGIQIATPFALALALADASGWAVIAAALLAAVVVAAYVNAFNFMDGINGISGTQAAVAGAFLALVSDSADLASVRSAGLAVCGAALGFLPFNAWRTQIFLGDVGSYFLGFWLIAVALVAVDAGVSPLVVSAPFLLYLGDTATVLVRRARRGESLTTAHREHAYQRLVQAGWSHVSVAAGCAAVSILCSAIMYALVDRPIGAMWAGFGVCLLIVVGYLAMPSRVESRRTVADGAML